MTKQQRSLCSALLLAAAPSYGIDLAKLEWSVVNDTVMGGRSGSTIRLVDNIVTFSGELSLANNGGFASVRAPYSMSNSAPNKLYLSVMGDGKLYQLRLRVDQYLDGPAFVYQFQTKANQQQTFTLSPHDFSLQYRGRMIESRYQLQFSGVRALGFLISAKQAGEFKLAIHELLMMNAT